MKLLEVKAKYLAQCNDAHVLDHYRRYMGQSLSQTRVWEWLAIRVCGDSQPLTNIDGTINVEPASFNWDHYTLFK